MAFKSVVIGEFFYKVLDFLRQLEAEHGPMTLAMMTSSHVFGRQTWDLEISAPWLDAMNLRAATVLVSDSAKRSLGEWSNDVSGTHIRRSNDYRVKTLVPVLDIQELGMPYRVEGPELQNLELDSVVAFKADKSLLAATEQRIPA